MKIKIIPANPKERETADILANMVKHWISSRNVGLYEINIDVPLLLNEDGKK